MILTTVTAPAHRNRTPLPGHYSILTRSRQRLGIDVFQCDSGQVVDLRREAHLVWVRELSFEATKVDANAGISSFALAFPRSPNPGGWPGAAW